MQPWPHVGASAVQEHARLPPGQLSRCRQGRTTPRRGQAWQIGGQIQLAPRDG